MMAESPSCVADLFSPEEIACLDPDHIPHHIAIVMDGNRRWAKKNQLLPIMGHWEGAEVLTEIVRAAAILRVKTITVYAFSTENWTRSPDEIESLMNIFEQYLINKKDVMIKEGICLNAIGDLARLPKNIQKTFEETRKATKNGQNINLILAINYGGRDEIRRVIKRIVEEKVPAQELSENKIAQYFDTAQWGDPDLVIRTSGELRISNFLLWQISYAELYVTDVLWPAFTPRELLKAILAFQSRERRIGGG